ncbi:Major facilitator superfamily domain-containing protein [Paramicrosporidium saccamoebae]|uniref:Major facilitator superfamily domain-containing protein n=1 Tax=Paramicrosporidium saccamoebae TaxID=1246581 RepID=A0A2H9TL88_9FUNG|nr:Major facilitator superfamily domain-containing protein [Paramicrosporidium saccamoebae]
MGEEPLKTAVESVDCGDLTATSTTHLVSPPQWRGTLEDWNARWLVLPKLIYLTLNCAIYATHNYTAMYFYRMWGIEVYQFGAVSSLSAVQFVGALFWAHLADRTGRHKSILLACTVLYGFFFCLLELKPFENHNTVLYKIIYSALMYGISCFFVSGLFPLVDTQVFSILAKDPNFTKDTFGKQRLWGTLGHGLVTLAVGVSIYYLQYRGMFIVLVLSCSAFVFFISVGIPSDIKIIRGAGKHGHHGPSQQATQESMPQPSDIEEGEARGCTERLSSTPAVRVLLDPHFFFLAVVILCAGYVRSVMSNFLGFYMQQEMHQNEIMVAAAIMFRMASEMAIFFYNKQLLRTIGLHWMLIIAQVAGLLRVLAYSVLPPTGNWFYLSFAIELLKGTSTGCLISSGVRMANDIAPKGCANTAQAYISGIYSGLSLAIGGALGGWIIYLLPQHSVAGMFRVTFYMGSVALILCVLKYTLVDRALLVPASWRRTPNAQ